MRLPTEILTNNLRISLETKQRFLENEEQVASFARAAEAVVECYRRGGRLYIAGNGGSAADAQHLAAELVSKMARDRRALPAEALTVDSSILTAIGNDYGYDQVFARQIAGKMTTKDIFLAITTSGRSPNIVEALRTCRRLSIPSILFSGRDGGPAKAEADHSVVVSGPTTSSIQEVHLVLEHALCECVEEALFADAP